MSAGARQADADNGPAEWISPACDWGANWVSFSSFLWCRRNVPASSIRLWHRGGLCGSVRVINTYVGYVEVRVWSFFIKVILECKGTSNAQRVHRTEIVFLTFGKCQQVTV